MITQANKALNFMEQMQTLSQIGSATAQPDWFSELKKSGITHFTQLGIPTVKNEEWKYTNIAPLLDRQYTLAATDQLKEQDSLKPYIDPNEITVVFVNGIFSKDLSSLKLLPKGLTIATIQHLLKTNAKKLSEWLTRSILDAETTFMALNKALLQDGIFVEMADSTIVERSIHLIHVTSNLTENSIVSPRTILVLGTSSQATLLQSHLSFQQELEYCSNTLTDIFLKDNAILKYTQAQSESLNSFSIHNTRVWQGRDTSFDGFSFVTGGDITRNNLDVVVSGEGASSILNGLYCINGKQLADNHTLVEHRVPHCTSNQLYKGILNGAAHAVFNGKILVRPEAQQTNSYQLNKNLILGKDCRVNTKPQLEIFADDVKCTHGATIGQLNEDEIFYLLTRCIPRQEAIRMLARGFVNEIVNRIAAPEIRQKIHLLLEPTFAAL